MGTEKCFRYVQHTLGSLVRSFCLGFSIGFAGHRRGRKAIGIAGRDVKLIQPTVLVPIFVGLHQTCQPGTEDLLAMDALRDLPFFVHSSAISNTVNWSCNSRLDVCCQSTHHSQIRR